MIFFFQAEDGIRGLTVTGVQTCALPIWAGGASARRANRCAPAGGGRSAGCSRSARCGRGPPKCGRIRAPAPRCSGRSRWRMRLKGRHWVAVWLVAFLAVTWLVYARQTAAIHDARELNEIRARRANLDGHQAELQRRVRTQQSRAVLVPRAQAKLGLHLPADSEIILVPLPGPGSGPP